MLNNQCIKRGGKSRITTPWSSNTSRERVRSNWRRMHKKYFRCPMTTSKYWKTTTPFLGVNTKVRVITIAILTLVMVDIITPSKIRHPTLTNPVSLLTLMGPTKLKRVSRKDTIRDIDKSNGMTLNKIFWMVHIKISDRSFIKIVTFSQQSFSSRREGLISNKLVH